MAVAAVLARRRFWSSKSYHSVSTGGAGGEAGGEGGGMLRRRTRGADVRVRTLSSIIEEEDHCPPGGLAGVRLRASPFGVHSENIAA